MNYRSLIPQPLYAQPDEGGAAVEEEAPVEMAEEDAEEEQVEDDDPEEDLEVDGKTYKVKQSLKPYVLREQDYRTKTHEIGESRRQLEAKQKDHQEAVKLFREIAQEQGEIQYLDRQLAEYAKVDWASWRQNNREAADDGWFQFQQLKERRNAVVGQANTKLQQYQQRETEAQAKRRAENEKQYALQIKGWKPEMMQTLKGFAKETFGFSETELDGVDDPRIIRMFHELHTTKTALEKLKARKPTPPPVIPTTRVQAGGKPPSTKPQDRDDPEAWLKKFNKQMGWQQ